MKAKWLPISAAVALALGSFSASAVDFHGYMRAGVQNNLTNGGAVYCFGNGNAGHLMGRLGDECDTYAEIALTQEVFNKAKNKFTVNTLIAWGTTECNWDKQGNSWQGVGNAGDRAAKPCKSGAFECSDFGVLGMGTVYRVKVPNSPAGGKSLVNRKVVGAIR